MCYLKSDPPEEEKQNGNVKPGSKGHSLKLRDSLKEREKKERGWGEKKANLKT